VKDEAAGRVLLRTLVRSGRGVHLRLREYGERRGRGLLWCGRYVRIEGRCRTRSGRLSKTAHAACSLLSDGGPVDIATLWNDDKSSLFRSYVQAPSDSTIAQRVHMEDIQRMIDGSLVTAH
jgi:hypothetical protein